MAFFIHGMTGNKSAFEDAAHKLEKEGWGYLIFDCRGAGQEDVTLTLDSMIEDIKEAWHFLKAECPNSKYVAIARGIGAMATLAALKDERDCLAKIFWAGIFYPKIDIEPEYIRLQNEINKRGYGEIVTPKRTYRVRQPYLDSLKSRQYAYHVRQEDKILLIHPSNDEVFPLTSLKEFISKTPPEDCKLITLENTTHPITHADEYVRHIIDFL